MGMHIRNFSIGLIIGIVCASGVWYALKAPSSAPLLERDNMPSTIVPGIPSGYGPTTPPHVTPPTTPPPAEPTMTDSGIRGSVLVGPTCPVERIPADPKCADRPLAAKFRVRNAAGDAVKEFSSTDTGTFSFSLPAGKYHIEQISDALYPRMVSDLSDVVVRSGQYTTVTIEFDSGIR